MKYFILVILAQPPGSHCGGRVGFHGESVSELRGAFEEAVDDYLETCEKLNRAPQKHYSGNLMLRLPPEIHAAIALEAEVSGKSINQWTTDILADVLDKK